MIRSPSSVPEEVQEEPAGLARELRASFTKEGAVILVVDDEDAVRELVTTTLRRLGYAMLSARHGHEALLLAERHPEIALLLTDVVMPGMSGPEIAQRLAFDRPDLRVLFMTGHSDHLALSGQSLAPQLSFLHKPFSGEMLLRQVRHSLAQADRGSQAAAPEPQFG